MKARPETRLFDREDFQIDLNEEKFEVEFSAEPRTCSSLCMYFSVMGSNSAVGVASRNDSIIGKSYSTFAYLKNPARSFLLMAPTLKTKSAIHFRLAFEILEHVPVIHLVVKGNPGEEILTWIDVSTGAVILSLNKGLRVSTACSKSESELHGDAPKTCFKT